MHLLVYIGAFRKNAFAEQNKSWKTRISSELVKIWIYINEENDNKKRSSDVKVYSSLLLKSKN